MSTLHEILLRKSDYSDVYYNGDLSSLALYKQANWRAGDVILMENDSAAGYRNSGKVLWDGEKCVSLDYEVDDYGSIPKSFQIGNNDWTADHWAGTIEHNRILYAYWNKELAEIVNRVWQFVNTKQSDSDDDEDSDDEEDDTIFCPISPELVKKYRIVQRKFHTYYAPMATYDYYYAVSFFYNGKRWAVVFDYQYCLDKAPFEDNLTDPGMFTWVSEGESCCVPDAPLTRTLLYTYDLRR